MPLRGAVAMRLSWPQNTQPAITPYRASNGSIAGSRRGPGGRGASLGERLPGQTDPLRFEQAEPAIRGNGQVVHVEIRLHAIGVTGDGAETIMTPPHSPIQSTCRWPCMITTWSAKRRNPRTNQVPLTRRGADQVGQCLRRLGIFNDARTQRHDPAGARVLSPGDRDPTVLFRRYQPECDWLKEKCVSAFEFSTNHLPSSSLGVGRPARRGKLAARAFLSCGRPTPRTGSELSC